MDNLTLEQLAGIIAGKIVTYEMHYLTLVKFFDEDENNDACIIIEALSGDNIIITCYCNQAGIITKTYGLSCFNMQNIDTQCRDFT